MCIRDRLKTTEEKKYLECSYLSNLLLTVTNENDAPVNIFHVYTMQQIYILFIYMVYVFTFLTHFKWQLKHISNVIINKMPVNTYIPPMHTGDTQNLYC